MVIIEFCFVILLLKPDIQLFKTVGHLKKVKNSFFFVLADNVNIFKNRLAFRSSIKN